MITAGIFDKRPVEHVCPRCGHVGHHGVHRLPSPAECREQGKGRWWEVQYAAGEPPVRYDHPPSEDEIRAEVARREADAAEAPKRARKAKDTPEQE